MPSHMNIQVNYQSPSLKETVMKKMPERFALAARRDSSLPPALVSPALTANADDGRPVAQHAGRARRRRRQRAQCRA